MALQLLDGTSATVDLNVAVGGGNTGSISMRCVIGALEYTSVRGYQSTKTLCSGQWEAETPGTRQDFIRVQKYASQGSSFSDLSVLMGATSAANVTATFQTGNTKIGTFWASSDSINVAAGIVAMPGELVLRSSGAVATVWVTT